MQIIEKLLASCLSEFDILYIRATKYRNLGAKDKQNLKINIGLLIAAKAIAEGAAEAKMSFGAVEQRLEVACEYFKHNTTKLLNEERNANNNNRKENDAK